MSIEVIVWESGKLGIPEELISMQGSMKLQVKDGKLQAVLRIDANDIIPSAIKGLQHLVIGSLYMAKHKAEKTHDDDQVTLLNDAITKAKLEFSI